MKRRQFLKSMLLTGAAVFPRPIVGRPIEPPAGRRVAVGPSVLDELTVRDIQAALSAKRYTSASLVQKYLARIEQIDRRGPKLNSVIELNPDAMAIARALDRERKATGSRGPLHGVPVLIKDNIDTHDRMTTTAGSLALSGSIPSRDSFVAQRLREAGAVILGKTNLSEWANFRSNRSTSGWSARGGLTRNPYALDRNPSGSSSGSAAAVAASLCTVAVGTETDGSILSPSSVNGIVGIKPTVGLVSRAGIIPIAHSQDTAGPLARTVTDAALLLGALAGEDSRDPATAEIHGKYHRDYTQFLDLDGLRGARIGVVRKYFGMHRGAMAIAENALATMRDLGAILVDPADLPSHGQIGSAEYQVLLYEFKADLNEYLAGLDANVPVRCLKDIIEFNERNQEKEMPYFQQEHMLRAEEKGPLTEQEYIDARAQSLRLSRDEGIDAAMNAHRLDALVAPTTGPAQVTDLILGDRNIGGSSQPAAVAGYPSITVPAGFVRGLPVGVSFIGRAFSEPILLRLAFAFEQACQGRNPPRFWESVPDTA